METSDVTLILIILLLFVILGGGYGWNAGYIGPANPLGLIILILLILVLFGALGGPRFGWW